MGMHTPRAATLTHTARLAALTHTARAAAPAHTARVTTDSRALLMHAIGSRPSRVADPKNKYIAVHPGGHVKCQASNVGGWVGFSAGDGCRRCR